jgi:hypothetical protein
MVTDEIEHVDPSDCDAGRPCNTPAPGTGGELVVDA